LAVPLNAGWNCISNPYLFDILPSDLRTADGRETEYLWERFHGGWRSKADISALSPWRGYLIWNGKKKLSDSLYIHPATHSATAKRASTQPGVRVSLSVSDGRFRDGLAVLGFGATGAENGPDQWDYVKPRLFSEPLDISLQVGWDNQTPYLTDIRGELENGQTWVFFLSLGKEAEAPTLFFSGLSNLPTGARALLLDKTSRQAVPLSGKPLPYPGGKQQAANSFEVAVGTPEYLAQRKARFQVEMERFGLTRITPNPLRRRTTITYSIPWSPNSQNHVLLRIFDIRGREVHTLVNNPQPPGKYSVTWNSDGTSIVPSRSYFCLLTAGKHRAVRKLIVLR
jgi:hypothetical protein